MNKVAKKQIYLLLGILIVNILTYFLLVPYAQKTANSHINQGDFFGIVYYVISVIFLVIGIRSLIKDRNILLFLLYAGFVITFAFWGYKLFSLYCLECASCG